MALDLFLLTTCTECNELLGPARMQAASEAQPVADPVAVLTTVPVEVASHPDSLSA